MQDLNKLSRLDHIAKEITLTGKADMRSLSLRYGVSIDTIRRDIKELHEKGILEATRGGAVSRTPIPRSFRERLQVDMEEKRIIANKAIPLIKPGQLIVLCGGTSIVSLAMALPTDIPFTVVTNNFPVISALEEHAMVEVLFAGGTVSRTHNNTTGTVSSGFFKSIRPDIFFIAPSGIHFTAGITSSDFEHANMEREIVKNARKVVALVTTSKLNTEENFKICDLSEIDMMITELDTNDAKLVPYQTTDFELL
ncbi:MAG: DeoR/GlpR transcriptional regulator [Chitinophagaceae bacterium]|nr:DeoR/GlpR transcriptional regulator [Chitinophagaceae bacterium]